MLSVNPVTKRIEHLRAALRETFSSPEGWLVAFGGSACIVLFSVVLSNLKILGFILNEDYFSFGLKLKSVLQTLWGGRFTFGHEGGSVTLVLAGLFGVNTAFIERYMRRQVRLHHAAGASAIGVLVGLLGVGCAACGSALLASLLGTGGALAALPLRGQEFSWIGIVLVVLSTFSLARKIVEPEACAMPAKTSA
jgi:hypothetical protein